MRLAIACRNVLFAAAATGALALTGCGKGEEADQDGATTAPGLATIEVGAETAPAEMLLDGVVEAVNQATLSAQTAGRVAEVPVDVNDPVKAGALLMRLRATEQVAGLGQAQAALQAAAAQDAQARAQFDRIRDMYERKVVARATYDEAVTARDAARVPVSRLHRPGSNRRAKAWHTPNCARRSMASSRPGTSRRVKPSLPACRC